MGHADQLVFIQRPVERFNFRRRFRRSGDTTRARFLHAEKAQTCGIAGISAFRQTLCGVYKIIFDDQHRPWTLRIAGRQNQRFLG